MYRPQRQRQALFGPPYFYYDLLFLFHFFCGHGIQRPSASGFASSCFCCAWTGRRSRSSDLLRDFGRLVERDFQGWHYLNYR